MAAELAALLDTLGSLSERLGGLAERLETEQCATAANRREVAGQLRGLGEGLKAVTRVQEGQREGLEELQGALADHLGGPCATAPYVPRDSVRWWEIAGQDAAG